MSRPAAFIDRDGVLNEERAFVYRPQDFVFIPGAIEGLRLLQRSGFALVVVTNQSGIARGLYTEADYLSLTAHIRERLGAEGVGLDAIEYCPHLPDAPVSAYRRECDCRKPKPGMLLRAIKALDIDPRRSFLVGDRLTDVEAGRAAGLARNFLVRTGYPFTEQAASGADEVYADLLACAGAARGRLTSRGV